MKKLIIAFVLASLAAFSLPAAADDFVISTGVENGGYWAKGKNIKNQILKAADKLDVQLDIEVVDSTGSPENITRMNDGDAQLIMVQADALNVMPVNVPIKTKSAGTEYVLWVYNTDNGYDDLDEIEGNEKAALVLVEGSGAEITMSSFVQEDGGYEKNLKTAIYAMDLEEAFDIVADGRHEGRKVAGLLHVGSSIPQDLAKSFKGLVMVGSASDSDFNDAEDVNGEALYANCEVTQKQAYGLTGFSDPDTVCVRALAVYTTDLESSKLVKAVRKGTSKALRGVK